MPKPTSILLVFSAALIFLLEPTTSIHAQFPNPPEEPEAGPPINSVAPIFNAEGVILEDAYPRLVMIADEDQPLKGLQIPKRANLALDSPGAVFVIDYMLAGEYDPWGKECEAFPDDGKTAFDYAASLWAANLHSTVPISIKACWADLGFPKLGYSGGGSLFSDFLGAPQSGTLYVSSLANALLGADLEPSRYDMYITYSSNWFYYYGLDAAPPSNRHDFVTLALHEIGHGLNFMGSAMYANGVGGIGNGDGYLNIYDTFVRDGDGDLLADYDNPSANLGFALTSNDLWFHGPYAMAANGGNRVKLYAPTNWLGGSSYAHLDLDTFNETSDGLMVPALAKGTAIHDPGAITLGLLSDLGWPDRLLPYPPEIVWASDSTFADKVRISWTHSSSTTRFEVYRHTSDTTVGATHLTPDVVEGPFDDIYATPGTEYYYWVKACNSAGCSEFSDSDTGTRGVFSVPDVPTGVSASDGAFTDMVWITWDDIATATYYMVYRDIDSSIAGATVLSDTVISEEYGDLSAAGLFYYYWIRACNSAGCSGYSSYDTGYIAPSGPSVPTGLAATDGTYKSIVELTWSASTGAKSYRIYRGTSDNSAKAELLQSGHTSTTYEDTSALPATIYYYWVRACSSDVCSGYSSSDPGHLTFTPPSTPTGLTASDGTSTELVQVSWNASEGEDWYQLMRNTVDTLSGAIELANEYPAAGFDDLYVAADVMYYYWVKACNDEGCSPYSASDSGYLGSEYIIYLPVIQKH